MIADAIRDCTVKGDVVLDTFLGSGTTLIACERVGRVFRGLEYEPKYVDVAVRRWEAMTKLEAVCAATGKTFDEIARERAAADDLTNSGFDARGLAAAPDTANTAAAAEIADECARDDQAPEDASIGLLSNSGDAR
jgi:hypothetical protein